ncbi:hypothetical protein SAMN05192558_101615 [Actinokineospora alba]|uniref:BioF2-like acetyltransferase domain-containing protein n=1 Tax=Actinokineospora alba TaxID=504798 RepID=A0A1H0G185_9PSEU|nr:GNAT family N-acetyltransferase [Actinokineospora alba]TDP69716.1 hypothetical protein C8E96_5310 [Actinokineospora alba]SDI10385.1 hypothetical protein SAMN05421871_103256 [Actinokineospora alba]SDO00657.1 hypothetical protein SAMN05192558_101615 [Actinokineospora alba]
MSIETERAGPRLGGLSAAAWDGLAGPHFYSSADWLGYCAAEFGGESAAAVSYQDGAPVCAVPYAWAGDSLFGRYRWHNILTAAGLPAPAPEGILVGPREGYQAHFLGTPGPAALGEVVDQVRVAARGQSCVAMYVTTEDALALRRAGVTATPVLLDADAWVEVPGGDRAKWEASLSSKRRTMVRREQRKFRDSGYRIEQVPLTGCWERLGAVASATQAKYGHATTPEVELAALRSHAVHMGDAAQVALLSTPEGSVVGFCLYYVWRGTAFLRWVGFDYERLAGCEYFSVVYYAQIECATELGIQWLHAGVGAMEAKAMRGARLRPLWLVDLTEDSVLAGAEPEIRAHNAAAYGELKAASATASAVDDDAWRPFL